MTPFTAMLAENSPPGGAIFWIVVFIAGIAVVAMMIRRHARKSAVFDDPRRQDSAEGELRHSMDRLLVELQEASREINATIDTKTAVLNKLIADADKRIEALKAAETAPAPARCESAPEPPPTAAPRRPEPVERDEVRRRSVLEHEIHRLADAGKTELEIARLTGLPRGEVELVLSLRRMPGAEGGDRP